MEQKQVPPPNTKQIKRMKKKSDELNKKISHSKRKHNNLISKRNLIRKKTEGPRKPEESRGPKEFFNLIELEQAFDRACRSYRIEGVEWM